MKFKTTKREQWIGRRKKTQSTEAAPWWGREYRFLIVALIVIVGIFWFRGGFDLLKGIWSAKAPEGYLEIEGRLITWQSYATGAEFSVTSPLGITRQYTFQIDAHTRVLHEGMRWSQSTYSRGALSAIHPSLYIKVYLQKPIKEDPASVATAVVYKE